MMAKAENFFRIRQRRHKLRTPDSLFVKKKLYKNNMIDDSFLLPDNNKDDSECVKFARISSQEPNSFFGEKFSAFQREIPTGVAHFREFLEVP